jgi:hypothetical protein
MKEYQFLRLLVVDLSVQWWLNSGRFTTWARYPAPKTTDE